MKLTPSLLLGAALLSTSLFISCGEKKDSASDDSDSANTENVETKDTPETLGDEMIVEMGALADALISAKDKASAETAVTKIDGIGDNVDAIAARMDKLETPSDEAKLALDAKMDKAMEAMDAKMQGAMKALMQNPEVSQILGPAMEKFGKRMQENDKVFERFGKKK